MSRVSGLLVGDGAAPEFQGVRTWLAGQFPLAEIREIGAALAWLAGARQPPTWIVLAQPRPGQVRAEEVQRLRRAAPLARLVALLGTWCEGETRSGCPWPGVYRLYWHEWVPRMAAELERAARGLRPLLGVPATASDADFLFSLSTTRRPRPSASGVVLVGSPTREQAEPLVDACRAGGWLVLWLPPAAELAIAGPSVLVHDATGDARIAAAEIEQLSSRWRPAAVISLCSFPRVNDHRRLVAAGAAAVLSKPLLVDDLLATVERSMPRQSGAGAARQGAA